MVQNTVIQMETLKLEQIDQQKQALRFHQMIDALPQVRMKQSWIARGAVTIRISRQWEQATL